MSRPLSRVRRISAFTLIELLTVTVIIAVLAGMTVGGIKGAKTRATIARAKTELAALANALEDYKRAYGDYPQLGAGGGITHAAADPGSSAGAGPGYASVQARLFNCLTGVFGPRAFTSRDRLNGPSFLDVGKFTLEGTLSATFQIPTLDPPNPPFKNEENVGLLDPWGRRYFYYYKNAGSPAAWQAPGYVLYSVGPDGRQDLTPQADGVMSRAQLTTTDNSDNLYANP